MYALVVDNEIVEFVWSKDNPPSKEDALSRTNITPDEIIETDYYKETPNDKKHYRPKPWGRPITRDFEYDSITSTCIHKPNRIHPIIARAKQERGQEKGRNRFYNRDKQLPTEQEFIEKYKNEEIKNIKEEIRIEHRKKTDYQEATRSHQIDFTQEVSESNTKINVLKQKLQEIQSL